jgi:hypothetical protein
MNVGDGLGAVHRGAGQRRSATFSDAELRLRLVSRGRGSRVTATAAAARRIGTGRDEAVRVVVASMNADEAARARRAARPSGPRAREPPRRPRRARPRSTRRVARQRAHQGARGRAPHRAARDRRRHGLEVDALGGRPGVHAARYAAGPGATYADNVRLLLELEAMRSRDAPPFRTVRTAWFRPATTASARDVLEPHRGDGAGRATGFGTTRVRSWTRASRARTRGPVRPRTSSSPEENRDRPCACGGSRPARGAAPRRRQSSRSKLPGRGTLLEAGAVAHRPPLAPWLGPAATILLGAVHRVRSSRLASAPDFGELVWRFASVRHGSSVRSLGHDLGGVSIRSSDGRSPLAHDRARARVPCRRDRPRGAVSVAAHGGAAAGGPDARAARRGAARARVLPHAARGPGRHRVGVQRRVPAPYLHQQVRDASARLPAAALPR